jgi:myo-inositol-1(or 4)-monophosphatase
VRVLITNANVAITAAQAGAVVARAMYGISPTLFEKSEGDFAAAADIEAEEAILNVLRSARPDDPVTGEESGRTGPSVAERMWWSIPCAAR